MDRRRVVFLVLEWIVWFKGMAEMITVDNCPKFIGMSLDAREYRHGMKAVFNRPGKSADNICSKNMNAGSGINTSTCTGF